MDPRPFDPMRAPAIDDNLLGEGCGHEIVDGEVHALTPASEAHRTGHFRLSALLRMVLRPAYKGAVDLLSRPKTSSNHAPDVSILPRARDEETGGRRVEEIVFDVVDDEPRAHVTGKTRALVARGVRRAFLVDVNDGAVHEWSRDDDGWRRLADDAVLTDPCFVVPVLVRAFFDDRLAEDTTAHALLACNDFLRARLARLAHEEAYENLAERRLRRPLTATERDVLLRRLAARGADVVVDQLVACTPDSFAAWLADDAP